MDPVDSDPQFHLLEASLLFRLIGYFSEFLSLPENFYVNMSILELGGVY